VSGQERVDEVSDGNAVRKAGQEVGKDDKDARRDDPADKKPEGQGPPGQTKKVEGDRKGKIGKALGHLKARHDEGARGADDNDKDQDKPGVGKGRSKAN
jgi:hypothetical protein